MHYPNTHFETRHTHYSLVMLLFLLSLILTNSTLIDLLLSWQILVLRELFFGTTDKAKSNIFFILFIKP